MRFTIAASALFAGLAIAMPAVTITEQSTEVDTITSCGAEVTNCPARSSSTSVPASSAATTTPISSSVSVSSVAPSSSASSPVAPVAGSSSSSSVVVTSAPVTTPAAGPSTIHVYSTEIDTITSCGPEVTNCPASSKSSSQTSYVTGTSVISVQSYNTLTASAKSSVATVVASSSAPFPISGNSTTVATATGTGASASAAYPSTTAYTGSASSMKINVASALGVVGALAFFL